MREVAGEPNSETVIDVVARGAEHWTYRLEPVTRRKHPLRVHMAALGAPIMRDRYYPNLLDAQPDDPARALQLVLQSLAFADPINGQPRQFSAPPMLAGAA
jgi:tRNA pseudouridine32 synthase/23S rRNA pseudouridine746 synthase